jgi:Pyruvate/2-oxoacid:ferredoxin oxidoreductase gamma subunit
MIDAAGDISTPLDRHEGYALLSATQALLKGLLESDAPVTLVAGPRREPFADLFRIGQEDAAAGLLQRHEIKLRAMPSAERAITVASNAARSGLSTLVFVPNDQLNAAATLIARLASERFERGGGLTIVMEDRGADVRESDPRRLTRQTGLACLEPADLTDLRDAMETTTRLSRAARCPVGLVVHSALLRSADTIEVRPNRVIESVDAILLRRRRRRRPRVVESGDVLRIVRRLELNRARALPSPGERVPVGFITVGPAESALRDVLQILRMTGRVPVLHLMAVHPLDDVAIARLLMRCEIVVVLEPRPGEIESGVLAIAEAMRHRGERPAGVWGRQLPAADDDAPVTLGIDEALHPSLLARRAAHVLHLIRPASQVAAQFVPESPALAHPPFARAMSIGAAAALSHVRRVAVEVDQWLRDQTLDGQAETDDEESIPPTTLAIDGVVPVSATPRLVVCEVWDAGRFRREGIAAIRQAALDGSPWMLIVCDVDGAEGADLSRLTQGVIPAERADRVHIEPVDLNDHARLTEVMREAALAGRLTVIIAGDGPPSRFDVAAIERALAEIDRLGYEPRQRVQWPLDRACDVRQPTDDESIERRLEQETPPLHSALRIDRLPRRRTPARLRLRPLVEQVEVIRTRPPARRWRGTAATRLPVPDIIHRRVPIWRAHVAGFRGDPPGVAWRILAAVGRRMGYAVRCLHDPTPIGAGRRAWTQVLYSHPRPGEAPLPRGARIPFGEADLLLGLDAAETLRAVASDRSLRVAFADQTFAVVNLGSFSDETDTEQAREMRSELRTVLRHAVRAQPAVIDDIAGACRAWFHTDRVVDAALIGAAFQSGLIPATLDAMEAAVADVEAAGIGRATEAFQFGRHLALDARLLSRPKDDRLEDADRFVRRTVHLLARRRGGRSLARRFESLVRGSLDAMPGLRESDLGRQARRDFVIALYRCLLWGGIDHAARYARLITDLYYVDRGESGRALTRNAVLPLAGAMLIRDLPFIATMTTSAEQRRRTRQILNVKRARSDEVRHRYLTRFELFAFGRRFRADVRTSDWPARLIAATRHVLPTRWRGSSRQRELRDYLIDLVERAARHATHDYAHHHEALARLHQQALDNRLRGMALAEIRMLAEPDAADGDRET